MALVKQARVLRNVGLLWLLCIVLLGAMAGQLASHSTTLLSGGLLGGYGGWRRWRALSRRIVRRQHRYEANKILVHYLHTGEILLTLFFSFPFLLLPFGAGLALLFYFVPSYASWSVVLMSSAGLACTSVLFVCVVRYERSSSPLYYQYDSGGWSGAEGMLYQQGTVIETLQPSGKVKMAGGVLWNAVSLSGETIAMGERVEVISVRKLVLYVDRLPATEGW